MYKYRQFGRNDSTSQLIPQEHIIQRCHIYTCRLYSINKRSLIMIFLYQIISKKHSIDSIATVKDKKNNKNDNK